MCGIVGFIDTNAYSDASELAFSMTRTLSHRGPDSSDIWLDADAGVALGHSRLAILDLSPAGAQPMESASGRYVIAFNGEIYNHAAMRESLDEANNAPKWRGHSDTEALLAAIEAMGVVGAVQQSVGMFAFALWDKKERLLTLGRDRLGEKPIYYGWQGSALLFGSELKALKAHRKFHAEVDQTALWLYLKYGYIPAPFSIYQHIFKLEPGCIIAFSLGKAEGTLTRYWSSSVAAENGNRNRFHGTLYEAADQLEALLTDAITRQMIADVPLGSFLSGGIDSSAITALMQKVTAVPVRTFSIGFHEPSYNEAHYAKAVASHLGTAHTELYVSADECMEVIPRLSVLYDEPFADVSQIPTYLVSALARSHVKVSLSGDGGDEVFLGYNRYALMQTTWRGISRIPKGARKYLATILNSLSPQQWDAMGGLLGGKFPFSNQLAGLGNKVQKVASVLPHETMLQVLQQLTAIWPEPQSLLLNEVGIPDFSLDRLGYPAEVTGVELIALCDLNNYLPDDILTKVDRAAMGNSLETRAPFLDHRVVEFSFTLPLEYKLKGAVTKRVLREVLGRYVPGNLIDRPKVGFGVPLDRWLRGPLREWAESSLCRSKLENDGFFNVEAIQKTWQEHMSGKRNHHNQLWAVLMFNQWLTEGG